MNWNLMNLQSLSSTGKKTVCLGPIPMHTQQVNVMITMEKKLRTHSVHLKVFCLSENGRFTTRQRLRHVCGNKLTVH